MISLDRYKIGTANIALVRVKRINGVAAGGDELKRFVNSKVFCLLSLCQ